MALAANSNIVHESETQRQHVRVKIPASIQFIVDGAARRHKLIDVSAGGFSFDCRGERYAVGQSFGGQLLLSVDAVGFSIPVTFTVNSARTDNGRIGCVLQDLGAQEIAALRQVITTFLSGELVTAGEMLSTLSRTNFVAARAVGNSGASSLTARIRAVTGTGLALAIGVAAFGYAMTRLYDIVVVTHAAAAKVAAQMYTITMPRDGTFFSLIPPNGNVKKGQPLGSFQTALLDVVAGVPGSFKLSPEDLSELVGQQLTGSLASPCDCVVQKVFVTDAQYVLRNQSLLELVPQSANPYVLARFHYDEIQHLPVGRKVHFKLSGSPENIEGTIATLRVLPAPTIDSNGLNDLNGLNTNAAITDIIAVIEPSVPLPLLRIDEPVDVRIDPLFAWLR
jgi:mannuronan synthase